VSEGDDILAEPLPFGADARDDTQGDLDYQRFLISRLHKPLAGMPGARTDGQDLSPKFQLYVTNGDDRVEIREDLSQYIESVEFESAVDMADMFEMSVLNPNFMFDNGDDEAMADATTHKWLQPGNEVELWGGYGEPDTFIGRAILTKHMPQFPQDGVPKLVVKGYSKSYLMMKASGDLQVQDNKVQLNGDESVEAGDEIVNPDAVKSFQPPTGPDVAGKLTQAELDEMSLPLMVQDRAASDRLRKQRKAAKGKDLKAAEGEVYVNMTPSDVVQRIADKWGFDSVIEDVPSKLLSKNRDGIIPKKDLSDYEIVKMLANLYRREFWVDYDLQKKNWLLHWTMPADNPNETPLYTFKYAGGSGRKNPPTKGDGSLLTYEAEYGIKDTVSSIVVLAWDPHPPDGTSGRWISVVEVTDVEGEERRWHRGGGTKERLETSKDPNPQDTVPGGTKRRGVKKQDSTTIRNKKVAAENRDAISHTIKSATEFRLAAGGFAIDMIADKPFESLQDLADYASRWFLANRDSFLVAKGSIVGTETVRAGQVHEFQGLGTALSGLYYFVAAKHKFTAEGIYTVDYIARKILVG
jgi:hypothetical protein